jgi:UV DNA damage repair endonuclease
VETEVVHADLVVADESEVSKIRKHYEALHRMELAEAEIALLSGEQLANLKKQQQKDLMAVLELLPKTVGICRC